MKLVTRIGAAGVATALAAGLIVPAATAASPGSERRAAASKVALKASKGEVVAGTRLVLSGKVESGVGGRMVVLQKKVNGKPWKAETTLRTTRKGAFRYADKPNTPGTRLYRAVVAKSGKAKAGKSRPVEVTVLQWHDLTDIQPRRSERTNWGGSVTIKGVAYASSVMSTSGAAAGSADWNLPATCTTLRVRLGAGDDSDDGAVAHLSLAGDGASLFTGSFTLTQSESRTFDISDVFRLAFTWSSTVPSSPEPAAGAQAVLGTPQLLCAF